MTAPTNADLEHVIYVEPPDIPAGLTVAEYRSGRHRRRPGLHALARRMRGALSL